MSEALSVLIDATEYYPRANAMRGTVLCRDIWQSAVATNVDLDPYSGAIICNPRQYNTDWLHDIQVERYPLSNWTGFTTSWEESTDSTGIPKYLHTKAAIGTDSRISTSCSFPVNCGFLLQAQLCGWPWDNADAFAIEFGQWKWKLNTSGKCYLYKGADLVHTDIYSGHSLSGEFVEISIMPAANGSLAIRPHRHTGAGIVYRLPAEDLTDDIPVIIEAGAFSIERLDIGLKRVQLTQLTYDTSLDYTLYSKPMYLPYPPITEQTLHVDFDNAELFGGAVAAGLWEQIVDTPFSPNGFKYIYRAIFQLTPYASTTPIVRGLHFTFDKVVPPPMGTPADVTADVRELTIETGQTAELTEAKITIRNPDTYGLFGVFNRPIKIMVGTQVLFLGLLKDPPEYCLEFNGDSYYTLTVQGLYRQLSAFSCNQDFEMDGQVHSDMVSVLCAIGGIEPGNLDIYTTTETLPDTRKPAGEGQSDDGSQFHCLPMDTPAKWIDEICDKTGWIFCDGHLDGDYVLRYIDPLVESTVPVTMFVLESSLDITGTLPRLRSWKTTSKPPECNELHVIGCNAAGELMDACYLDLASQDGTLLPELRPANWLGGRVAAAISMDGTNTPEWLQAVALRVGTDVCNRVDVLRTEGDWPDMLWTGHTVTVTDGVTSVNYKIVGLSINFMQEIEDNIIRRADYLMERQVL